MTSSPTKKSTAPIIIGAVILLVIAAGIGVFLFRGSRERAFTPREQEATKYMRSDLEGLILAEATTNRTLGRYVVDPDQAGALQSVGVDRPQVHVTEDGWWATITSPSAPGVRCAVAINARNPLKRLAKSAEIVCR
jgi:hypothetical protein